MSTLIVVDNPGRWPLTIPGAEVVAARRYLTDPAFANGSTRKVFNLCRSYRYQASGYYVSLLAEARGHRVMPSVGTLQDMRLAPVLRVAGQDLSELIQRSFKPLRSDSFEFNIYFGRSLTSKYDPLAQALFNQFPAPFLRTRFEKNTEWEIDSVKVIGAADIPDADRPFIIEQAQKYFEKPFRKPRRKRSMRYDMAILHDPAENPATSDEKALKNFVDAAESVGIEAELIRKDAYGRVGEFDALFIRENTGVTHHTYRFSSRAAAEGLVVIDDPVSIVRCTNKVFLAELLERKGIPTPRTFVFSEETAGELADRIGFPCVVKQPDSSFSVGVEKIESPEDFERRKEEIFDKSELLLAQEFVPTEFDWRIGVLNGEPLYVCKYYMARKHWQILKREGGKVTTGTADVMPVHEAPKEVVKLAVKAARLIGDGLYGVDMKELGGKRGRPVVIEINDNPTIESGVEDRVLGDALYERIMLHFLRKLESWGV